MKIKKLLIIGGIVLVLLALTFAKNIFQKVKIAKSSSSEPAILLIKDDPAIFVNKIEIYNGIDQASKLVLVREPNGEWVIASKFKAKARKEAVEGVLNNLRRLKGEVRGESKDLFADFALQDNQSGHLILKDASDKILLNLVVSFKMTNWNQSYARLADSEEILLLNGDVLGWFGMLEPSVKPQSGVFADYGIFSFDTNLVVKIDLIGDARHSLVMSRSEPAAPWRFEKSRNKTEIPDPGKVNDFLLNILNSTCLDMADPKLNSYGFDHPVKTLKLDSVKAKKTTQIQIEIGAPIKEKNAFYARVFPENKVYILPDSFMKLLDRDKASFISKPVKKKNKR